jgi:hypothetical protein
VSDVDMKLEQYYTVREVADALKVDSDTVRTWLKDDPTVFKWGNPETRFKRAYTNWRIPKSTIERMMREGKPPGFCT